MLNLKAWMEKITTSIDNLRYLTARGKIAASYPTSGYTSNLPEGGFSTGPMITLSPHTSYLVLGQGQENNGGFMYMYSSIVITSGTGGYVWSADNQPYGGAGNTHPFIAYVETGANAITIGVNAHIYSGGDRGYLWHLLAIPIGYGVN